MKRQMPLVVWILWAVSGGCLLILSGCYSLRGRCSRPGRHQRLRQPSRLTAAFDPSTLDPFEPDHHRDHHRNDRERGTDQEDSLTCTHSRNVRRLFAAA